MDADFCELNFVLKLNVAMHHYFVCEWLQSAHTFTF